MTDFYLGIATFVLAMVALGLLRVVRGPNSADRMMAAQLLGTGGVAILLLSAVATGARFHRGCRLADCASGRFCGRGVRQRRPGDGSGHRRGGGSVMSHLANAFTIVMLLAGAFFFLAGTVGLLRFPDSLTRLHALTKVDNLGLGLIVFGLLPQIDGLIGGLKLILVWLLVQLASAMAAQLIARVARREQRR